MVPVTTKPFLNIVSSSYFSRGIPAFFLSIKEKFNRDISYCEKQDHGRTVLYFAGYPYVLYTGDNYS